MKRLKKFVSVAICSIFILAAHNASGDEPKVIYPIKKGEVAPFNGVLFSQTASADWIAEMKAQKDRADAFLKEQIALSKAEADREISKVQSDAQLKIDTCNLENSILKNDIGVLKGTLGTSTGTSPTPSSSTSPWWYFGAGTGIGTIATLGTVFVIVLTKKLCYMLYIHMEEKTKGSFLWIRDTRGHESVSVTFVTVGFWVTTFAYIASIFQSIGPVTFRQFDSTACLTFLGPLLALYFGRKMNETKLPTMPVGQAAQLPILTDAPTSTPVSQPQQPAPPVASTPAQ